MYLFLNKKLTFITTESKEEFFRRLEAHAVYSKTKNFFTATTDDYAIKIKLKGDVIIIDDKFKLRRNPFRIKVTVSSAPKTTITVSVRPEIWSIILLITVFCVAAFCIAVPVVLLVAFVITIYIFTLINLSVRVWWTEDLFLKKLLKKDAVDPAMKVA